MTVRVFLAFWWRDMAVLPGALEPRLRLLGFWDGEGLTEPGWLAARLVAHDERDDRVAA